MNHSHFILLAVLGLLLTLVPAARSLSERAGIPAPIAYIGLGLAASSFNANWPFINDNFSAVFSVLAELGVVALLFRVGLRSRLQALLAKLPSAALIWAFSVAFTIAAGFLLARGGMDLPLESALVIAVAFSASSVALSVAVWDDLGLLNSDSGVLLIDVAEMDDLSAVVLLAMLLSLIPLLQDGNGVPLGAMLQTGLWTMGKLVGFVLICYVFAHFLERRFLRLHRAMGETDAGLVITIIGMGLLVSALAGQLGFSLAIGALFAGLAFSGDPDVVRNEGGFSHFYDIFSPFFFIGIGIHVAPAAFFSSLELGLILFAVAACSKFIGVALPALLVTGRRDAIVLGLSMVPRAEIALLVVYQCSQLGMGIISDEVFAACVVATTLTALTAPPLVRWCLRARSV